MPLPFEPNALLSIDSVPHMTALEGTFPARDLSDLGLKESWRKEVHRPATSTHKWWAKRLGTVFRGIISSAVTENGTDAMTAYSSRTCLDGLTMLDPFGGSGVSAVEGIKLGARVISFDINPVATLVQRQAVQTWDVEALRKAYGHVESECRSEIERVHKSQDGRDVLYYFWVALADCLECGVTTRLFDSPIFSRHAYPKKYPQAQIVCPQCLDVFEGLNDFQSATCGNGHEVCSKGAVSSSRMTCANGHISKVTAALAGQPPRYEMFAKLVSGSGRSKVYEPISEWDRSLYAECEELLASLPDDAILPEGRLEDGNNTRQALAWNFREWKDFFNARQAYSLSLLAEAVSRSKAGPSEREALCALFSGTLEFNNLFCSFKGEGTGAVRHMFSHHVLKPERTPLEAHPWGTPQSSGSFSTLFNSRLIRAHDYKTDPADLVISNEEVVRVKGISRPLETPISVSYEEFASNPDSRAYIRSCNSAETDLPSKSVDIVVTDPPYMDNVHYAELADFFHAWLHRINPYDGYAQTISTRADGEVQQADPEAFGRAIGAVWSECNRVLKDDGLIAFTFHQARISGWVELVKAIREAGLQVTAIQPVKGEMTRSITKSGAREPSNLDSIVVCRKSTFSFLNPESLDASYDRAVSRLHELIEQGVEVGAGDIRSVMRGSLLAFIVSSSTELESHIEEVDRLADQAIAELLGV